MDPEERIDSVPLSRAILCLDCEQITASEQNCSVCGSRSVLSLARIIDREEAAA